MASARVIIKSNLCPSVAAKFPREVNKLVRQQVFDSEAHVKVNVVKYDVIDTGHLLSSVGGEMTAETTGMVSVAAEYARFQNDGTTFISPRPFFSDELHRAETAFPARFKALEGMLS